jgi:hypothetical protein
MGVAISPVPVGSRLHEFLDQPRKILINGQWVNAASGKTFRPSILQQVKFWPWSLMQAPNTSSVRQVYYCPN